MNGRTNAKNGGGAIRSGCAVLEVRAPAYSQITATRSDGLTKKQSKGYVDLSDSNFWFYYIVIQKFEFSDLTWTVVATKNDSTDSDIVIIEKNQYYYISLAYHYYLYKKGNEFTDRTGGWVFTQGSGQKQSDGIYMRDDNYASNYPMLMTTNNVSFSPYTKIIYYLAAYDTYRNDVPTFGVYRNGSLGDYKSNANKGKNILTLSNTTNAKIGLYVIQCRLILESVWLE